MNIRARVWAARIVVAVCGVLFVVVVVRATLYAPIDQTAVASAFDGPLSAGDYPVRFRIPSIGVNAAIQYVGVTKTGAMGTPNNFTDVAWYKDGSAPGEVGSAVIDGHVDNGLALAGVFKKLNQVAVGDDIYVQTASSSALHFSVVDIESYPYKDVPTGQIFNRTDAARLNLITCEGIWVPNEKTYDQRLVVYAVLVK